MRYNVGAVVILAVLALNRSSHAEHQKRALGSYEQNEHRFSIRSGGHSPERGINVLSGGYRSGKAFGVDGSTQALPLPVSQPYQVNRPVPTPATHVVPVSVPRPAVVAVSKPVPVSLTEPYHVTANKLMPQTVSVPQSQAIPVSVSHAYPATFTQTGLNNVPQSTDVPLAQPIYLNEGNEAASIINGAGTYFNKGFSTESGYGENHGISLNVGSVDARHGKSIDHTISYTSDSLNSGLNSGSVGVNQGIPFTPSSYGNFNGYTTFGGKHEFSTARSPNNAYGFSASGLNANGNNYITSTNSGPLNTRYEVPSSYISDHKFSFDSGLFSNSHGISLNTGSSDKTHEISYADSSGISFAPGSYGNGYGTLINSQSSKGSNQFSFGSNSNGENYKLSLGSNLHGISHDSSLKPIFSDYSYGSSITGKTSGNNFVPGTYENIHKLSSASNAENRYKTFINPGFVDHGFSIDSNSYNNNRDVSLESSTSGNNQGISLELLQSANGHERSPGYEMAKYNFYAGNHGFSLGSGLLGNNYGIPVESTSQNVHDIPSKYYSENKANNKYTNPGNHISVSSGGHSSTFKQ